MSVSAPRFLAIDSSTDTLSVALGAGGEGDAPMVFRGPGSAQASTTLLPAVQSLLAQAGWTLPSLTAIVFGRGPGSFTGLRTACAVAQGLAYGAGGLPVLPIDTLLALAESARQQRVAQGLPVPPVTAALLDARMDEIYVALYANDPEAVRPEPLQAPRLCVPGELATWLAQCLPSGMGLDTGDCLLAGNVFEVYAGRLDGLTGPRQPALPTADALLALAPALMAAGQAVAARDALPLYVRDKVARTTLEREGAR
ncbi:MAG: tRNA (adenosine(37)-N6)-threonylcarbamoyltransferase complex dimerization subunit type 1 TsaB [Hydrogenophaga sp.]|nr:tRNA (adenosine(37)-N6)-threonylcarbamoyltransferase complex dimerization subunit type 1 TsaB [Hydrogenophaga sp.]